MEHLKSSHKARSKSLQDREIFELRKAMCRDSEDYQTYWKQTFIFESAPRPIDVSPLNVVGTQHRTPMAIPHHFWG